MKNEKGGKPFIILATPHSRNDSLEESLRTVLEDYEIIRLCSPKELALEKIRQIDPAYIFFPHWSWIIPEDIFANFECVVFHMTDLPYGRGGSPLQNLIIRGYKDTKLTALRCVNGLDAGPIYQKRPLSLAGTAEEILQRASALMYEMIIEIVENHLVPVQQQGEVVLFKRRHPEDGNLAPLAELGQVYDYIRMLDADGYPGAFIETEKFHMEFSEAKLDSNYLEAKVLIRRKSP